MLARTLAGLELNGALDALPDRYHSMVAHLEGLPKLERQPAFEAMTATWADPEQLVKAVADEDPEGPAPEDDGDSLDEWGPIRLGTLPPVEAFPLDVLPCPARDLATAAAESIGCPIDFPAVAILAAASGLIGRSARLFIKPGYLESACIYVGLVGTSSSGKSPALGAALAPVWRTAEMLHQLWRAEMTDWKKADAGARGEEPNHKRIVTTDPTTEALGPILARNPRGLIVAPDEMTRWVMSMDQYKGGKGGDRPFYLSVWKGESVYIDRAKHMREPIVVPDPFLTVVGGLTPGMLSELPEGKGRDDGFMARLLFTWPEKRWSVYSDRGVPEDAVHSWERMARSLWNRELRESDGKPIPQSFKMTSEASAAWARWCNEHRGEQQADDFPESLEGPWGKLEAYAARLALILHLIRLASDPRRDPGADPPDLPRRIVDDSGRLVAYFKSHARRVYAAIDGKLIDGGENVRVLVRWILRNNLSGFSTRDISRNIPRFRNDPEALDDALGWMESAYMVRPRERPDTTARRRGGRKRAPEYDVSPELKVARFVRHYLGGRRETDRTDETADPRSILSFLSVSRRLPESEGGDRP
jgi:hypothetical protein